MVKSLKVLLVEDLSTDVKFIKEILNDIPDANFNITSVNTLSKALKKLDNSFDVILLDLNLPDSKGVSTFEKLKEKSLETPIIILTVIEDKRLMIDAVRTGAQDYLIKRFITTDSLERAILYGIERKIAEFNLKKALNDLKISNEELQNFAYMMSHDLQDPLKTISNFLSLIKKRAKLDKKNTEFIDITIDASKKMQKLINDLLTYSRIQSSTEGFTKIDLNKVFEEAKMDINGKKELITSDKLPIVKARYSQILIVFLNLLSNALKFSKNKEVHVGYKKEAYSHIISFKDKGIGIKTKDFKRIFKFFEKLNPQSEFEGSGLGLSIVKKIMQAHKGKIWVKSTLGKGSTFFISFPKN